MARATAKPRGTVTMDESSPWRANKRWVSYAGRRWRLCIVRGAYCLLERRGCSQWVPLAVCK